MRDKSLKIIITGHVDHGKSTLIGRLLLDTNSLPKEKLAEIKKISRELGKDTELAFVTDQLKEEREQSLTIDTTQIFFRTDKRHYVIIDSPGHAEFIKNMFTGATQAQAAVLLIDLNEGIREQSRRHAYILGMLGIQNVIVACNKMDLIQYSEETFNQIKNEFLKFLANVGIKPLFIIPISAREGANISHKSPQMKWFKGPSLLDGLDRIKADAEDIAKPFRFSVQDVYNIEGKKIIAGKVISGVVRKDQEVMLLPSKTKSRIASIEVFQRELAKAEGGENIGLTLQDDPHCERGGVISETGELPHLTERFKGDIFWMSEEPLRIHKKIVLRCATQEIPCVAEKIEKRINSSTLEIIEENAGELKTNEAAVVLFKTEKPLVIERFDFIEELGRFVIEQDYNIQGAGIITTTACRQNYTSSIPHQ
jgi:sulfate adenylyltransferase large subunit